MPNDFGHYGGGPVGPMSGPGPIGGHDHCDHPEITDYTMGANYAPTPGLPDHIKYKPHINDELKIDPANIQRVNSFFKRIKLSYKLYEIKQSINLNCRIYYKNEKKIKKLKVSEDKYRVNGIITGRRLRKLHNKMSIAESRKNTAERYLNGRLYNNYMIYQRYLTGYDVDYIKENDDYYDAHIKEQTARKEKKKEKEGNFVRESNQGVVDLPDENRNSIPTLVSTAMQSQSEIESRRRETLIRIKALLKNLGNMGDLVDSTKYNQILVVSNHLAGKLSDNDPKVDAALEYADAELMKMLKEATENYSNARRRS